MMKKTEVMRGNKKFDWDEVWRNIRRAGAIVELQPGELDQPCLRNIRADASLI